MNDRITNDDNYIDVRDIIARVEQLEALRTPGSVDLGSDEDHHADQDSLFAELAMFESLLSELAGNGGDEDWRGSWYPISLIRESHWVEYAQELAEDIGAIKKDSAWPNNHIDGDAAADALLVDYSSVEFDGVTYYYR